MVLHRLGHRDWGGFFDVRPRVGAVLDGTVCDGHGYVGRGGVFALPVSVPGLEARPLYRGPGGYDRQMDLAYQRGVR